MDQDSRLRFAVEAFPSLQGLRWVPFALAFAVNPWFQEPGHWDLGVVLGLMLAAAIASVAIRRFYRDRFGFLRPRRMTDRQAVRAGAALIALFAAFLLYSYWQVRLGLPVSAWGMFWVACFGSVFVSAPRLRWYWGATGLVLLAVVLLPCLGFASPEALFGQHSRVGAGLVGLGVAVCALMDHRLLVRLLPPLPQGGEAELPG